MLELNGGSAVAFPLIWGETDCSRLEQAWRTPDLVVAADVIYDRNLISPLLETVKSLGRLSILALWLLWLSVNQDLDFEI